mmetsp:Transcript_20350/g.51718  ORF Transcript_20350/g.51718 Transcript_20350/m.51718 type:complete len:299 (-) Transcript_20350:845-1741(-)
MHYIFARAPGGPHAVPAAGWLEQALPREVVVSLLWHHVAHRVLVLLVDLRDKFLLARLRLQRLVQCVGIVDHSDAVKPFAVRDSQTAHGVCVARLLKVALELTRAPVGQPAADFALVLEVEPVQFVEPVGDGLPVPAQGEVLRVVDRSRVVFVLHLHLVALAILLISVRGEQIRLNLFKGAGSHLFDVACCLLEGGAQDLPQFANRGFQERASPALRLGHVCGVRPSHIRVQSSASLIRRKGLCELLLIDFRGVCEEEEKTLRTLGGTSTHLEAARLQLLFNPLGAHPSLNLLPAREF